MSARDGKRQVIQHRTLAGERGSLRKPARADPGTGRLADRPLLTAPDDQIAARIRLAPRTPRQAQRHRHTLKLLEWADQGLRSVCRNCAGLGHFPPGGATMTSGGREDLGHRRGDADPADQRHPEPPRRPGPTPRLPLAITLAPCCRVKILTPLPPRRPTPIPMPHKKTPCPPLCHRPVAAYGRADGVFERLLCRRRRRQSGGPRRVPSVVPRQRHWAVVHIRGRVTARLGGRGQSLALSGDQYVGAHSFCHQSDSNGCHFGPHRSAEGLSSVGMQKPPLSAESGG